MSAEPTTIARTDWPTVVATFTEFFGSMGDVTVTDSEAEFRAEGTGLALRRDGTSRSFMPLHSLEAGWESIAFDAARNRITLIGANARYTYQIPSRLLS